MALPGWRTGIPRASGNPGKDLNSWLECRSRLIPTREHGGGGEQTPGKKAREDGKKAFL